MRVLIFSTTFVWNMYHSKKNQQNIIKVYIGLHAKYLLILSDFN
jgi:hypothetical protein